MDSRLHLASLIAMAAAAALVAASCQSSARGSRATPASAPVPQQAAPSNLASGDALYNGLAGNSILGFTAAGEPTCEYFRADGAVMTSNAGREATGTWTVDGTEACQQLDGPPVCKLFSFAGDGSVSSWLAGTNTPIRGEVVAGDRCST